MNDTIIRRVYVWELPVRLYHSVNFLCVTVLAVTGYLIGNPISISKAISSSGKVTDGAPSGLTGYSVIKADNIDAATALAKGCPHLSSGGGVEVYETFNAM